MKLVGGTYLWVIITVHLLHVGRPPRGRRRAAARRPPSARCSPGTRSSASSSAPPPPSSADPHALLARGATMRGTRVGSAVVVVARWCWCGAVLRRRRGPRSRRDPAAPGAALVRGVRDDRHRRAARDRPGALQERRRRARAAGRGVRAAPASTRRSAPTSPTAGRSTRPRSTPSSTGGCHARSRLQAPARRRPAVARRAGPAHPQLVQRRHRVAEPHHVGPEPALLDDRPAADGDPGHRARRPLPAPPRRRPGRRAASARRALPRPDRARRGAVAPRRVLGRPAPRAPGSTRSRPWLDAPGNEHEVLLLYLQNELDGDPAAHAATVGRARAGPRRPRGAAAGRDARQRAPDLPIERSRADLLADGPPRAPRGQLRARAPGRPGCSSAATGWDERSNSRRVPRLPGLRGRPRRPRLRRAPHPRHRGPDLAVGHRRRRRRRSPSPRCGRWCGAGWS